MLSVVMLSVVAPVAGGLVDLSHLTLTPRNFAEKPTDADSLESTGANLIKLI
jgi:hypothetical protein